MFEKEAEALIQKNIKLNKTPRETVHEAIVLGYNKAKEEMQENGLALQSDMDKTIEQNIALKKKLYHRRRYKMETAVILVPILWTENKKELLEDLKSREQKAKLDSYLADGYQIKIMNDFEYEHIFFTHFVLAKE